jgi:hypothetical protein
MGSDARSREAFFAAAPEGPALEEEAKRKTVAVQPKWQCPTAANGETTMGSDARSREAPFAAAPEGPAVAEAAEATMGSDARSRESPFDPAPEGPAVAEAGNTPQHFDISEGDMPSTFDIFLGNITTWGKKT